MKMLYRTKQKPALRRTMRARLSAILLCAHTYIQSIQYTDYLDLTGPRALSNAQNSVNIPPPAHPPSPPNPKTS